MTMTPRPSLRLLLMLCAVLIGWAGASGAGAATTTSLSVDIGWNGAYRFGRWAPVYVTASDARPRNVLVELYVPHDQMHAMKIHQVVTIGPTPTTFALYAPLGG